MDSIEVLKAEVNAAPLKGERITEVSQETGIARSVIRDIYYGKTTNPRMNVVRALDAWAQKIGTQ